MAILYNTSALFLTQSLAGQYALDGTELLTLKTSCMHWSLPALPNQVEKALVVMGIALMVGAGRYSFRTYDETVSAVTTVNSTFQIIDREIQFFRDDSARRWTPAARSAVVDSLRERRRALIRQDDANQQKLESITSDLDETGHRVLLAKVTAGAGLLLVVVGLEKWFRSPTPESPKAI